MSRKGKDMNNRNFLSIIVSLILFTGQAYALEPQCDDWLGTWDVQNADDTVSTWVINDVPEDTGSSIVLCQAFGKTISDSCAKPFQILFISFAGYYSYSESMELDSSMKSVKVTLNAGKDEFEVSGDAYIIASGTKTSADIEIPTEWEICPDDTDDDNPENKYGDDISHEEGTNDPWPSWRHDLLNTAAAPDSGYPTTAEILWSVHRSDRPDKPGTPAAAGGPVVVDNGMVYTTGKGLVEAVNQFSGKLLWAKTFPTKNTTAEPADAPYDWCYHDIPTLEGNTGICYVPDIADCPPWCFECTTEEPDCSALTLINPVDMGEGYAQFIAGPTLDTENNCIIFGTFDGRVISLNMNSGETNWEVTPFNDLGGPNVGAPWYDQKFAWHLSPPSIHNGKVYIGSFLPGFYWPMRSYPFRFDDTGNTIGGGGYWGVNFDTYWVGHDGWFYALDQNDGSILWDWDPQGCGIAIIPPVDSDGNVYIADDFHTNYCQGLFRSFTSNGEHNWTFGPTPVAQGGSASISDNTIFFPGSDGVLRALNKNTGMLKWSYHGGFCSKGMSGLTSATAVDETHGWVLEASDTGHIFVLEKDTGKLIRDAYLGLPGWNPGDERPSSGFWFAGSGAMAIVPSQTLLYIAATDYDQAWQGMSTQGKEKLFCYNYGSGPELTLVWEYQFCSDNDECADLDAQHIVRGWDEQTTSFYNVPSPALADGHVYYNSFNGKVYCFGSSYNSPTNEVCPSEAIVRNKHRLHLLRELRDTRMASTATGKALTSLYYSHANEITKILLADKTLEVMAANVIGRISEKAVSPNKNARINQSLVDAILKVADSINAEASQELSEAIQDLIKEIETGKLFEMLGIVRE